LVEAVADFRFGQGYAKSVGLGVELIAAGGASLVAQSEQAWG